MSIQFGSKEWFDKLNEISKFPSNFVFYVDTEGAILSTKLNSKAENIENLQFKTLKSYRSDVAIIGVKKCHTDMEYYEECKRLREIWPVKKELEE